MAWTAPQNFHLTLKFLGAVDEARVPDVAAALIETAAAAAPFELTLRGLGAFPSPTRPRVLWAGAADGAAAAGLLAARIDAALAALGLPPETRPFSCHVTLGRVRQPRAQPALAEALAAGAGLELGRVSARRVSLMRSELSPRGARYTELAACPLGGGVPAG